jgi:hypothetical protein
MAFLSGFPTKTVYPFHFVPMRATFPAHSILLDLIILISIGEAYKQYSERLLADSLQRKFRGLNNFLFNAIWGSENNSEL